MPFDPDAFLANSGEKQPSTPASGFDPDDFLAQPDNDHNGIGEKIQSGIEGAARGVIGPAVEGLASGLRSAGESMGVSGKNLDLFAPSPETLSSHQEENPLISHGSEAVTQAAGLLTGKGLPGLIGKAGEAVAGATGLAKAAGAVGEFGPKLPSVLAKIGGGALKGAIETGLLQGSSEISNALMGKGDQEAPVAGALWNIGAAGLLGGALGGTFGAASAGLNRIGETKSGTGAKQWLEDFGNRWKVNQEGTPINEAVTNELSEFHNATKSAADEVYGASGLKSQAIRKLVPEMNDAISGQSEEIGRQLQSRATEMLGDPETYPPRLYKKFAQDVNQWMETSTNPKASSYDVFDATQELKQKLQSYAKYDKQIAPFAPEKEFVNSSKEISSRLRSALEDSRVWGDAGDIQKNTNKAFTEFLPSLKDFERRFTTKIEGDATIDPGKINTYVNQIGKPNAEIKQSMMKNFVEAAETYRNKIADLHGRLGLESPLEPASLNSVKSTYSPSSVSAGSKAADMLYHVGIPKLASHTAGTVIGGEAGYHEGGIKGAVLGGIAGALAPAIGQAIGKKITHNAVPLVLKVLSSGNVEGLQNFLDYANHAERGAQKMNSGVDDLFRSGSNQFLQSYRADDKSREKLRNYIENGQQNEDVQAQSNKLQQPQGFAHGGDVMRQPDPKPGAPILDDTHGLNTHAPEQANRLMLAKGRINNYLNSVRPQPIMDKLPFDREIPDKQKTREYDKVLDLANQPLSILNHVKDGTLTPQMMNHFTQLYPEIHNQLSKKITERITQSQVSADTPPPYKVRQSMGLFLGAPLDASMTPRSIMAAQSVYAQARETQQMAPDKPKKGTAVLSKASQQVETGDQSRQQRQQKL